MVKILKIYYLQNNPKYSNRVVAPFDEGVKYLESINNRIISLEELANLRTELCSNKDYKYNNDSKISIMNDTDGMVKEGFIFLPDKKIYLTKNSPIMKNPIKATKAHEKALGCSLKNHEFYLTDEQVQESLKGAVQITPKKTLITRLKDHNLTIYAIPTNRFGEEPLTIYAFGNIAEKYGLLLNELGAKEMPIFLPPIKGKKAYARQVYAMGISGEYRAGLDGFLASNLSDHSMFGISQEKINNK